MRIKIYKASLLGLIFASIYKKYDNKDKLDLTYRNIKLTKELIRQGIDINSKKMLLVGLF